jgi:hypothetical protein
MCPSGGRHVSGAEFLCQEWSGEEEVVGCARVGGTVVSTTLSRYAERGRFPRVRRVADEAIACWSSCLSVCLCVVNIKKGRR